MNTDSDTPQPAAPTDELAEIFRRCYGGQYLADACQGTSYADRIAHARYALETRYNPLRFDDYGAFAQPWPIAPSPEGQQYAARRFECVLAGHPKMHTLHRAIVEYITGTYGALPPEPPDYTARQELQDIFERVFVPRGWKVDSKGYVISPFRRSAAQRRDDHIWARFYDPENEPEAFARVRRLVAATQSCGR